jgi:hypothetical protein
MKIRRGPALQILPPQAPARRLTDPAGEITRIVRHLEVMTVPHIEAAKRIGYLLGAHDIHAVIDALEAEAQGLDPNPHLDCPSEVRRHQRQSLYEELLSEPSNIFRTSRVDDETTRYEALDCTLWLACLKTWRLRLAPGKNQKS